MDNGRRDDWKTASLRDGTLVFDTADGFDRAREDGFFFVRRPPEMDLSAGDRFARSFYLPEAVEVPDPFRGFCRWTPALLGPYEGYYSRDVDQTEQFFLESHLWGSIFPAELARQAVVMRDFALAILRAVLSHLEIPVELSDEATGHCLTLRGTYHLTFNHFRPGVRARGLNIHKDSGWVTVLRSLEPGLEVWRDGQWCPINPSSGTFIVNFGCAMEILTRQTKAPVSAVAHRVIEQLEDRTGKPDRFSYGLFVDSSLDQKVSPGLFRFEPGKGLVFETSFKDFLDKILSRTYDRDTQGLY